MKKYLIGLLSFLVIVTLLNCKSDVLVNEGVKTNEKTITLLTENELPNLATNKLFDFKRTIEDSNFKSDAEYKFGEPVTDIIYEITNENGNTTYTMALESLEFSPTYFDNLLITKKNSGEVTTKIIRYTPDSDWFDSKNNLKDLSDFTGYQTLFDENGVKMGASYFKNGIKVETNTKTTDYGNCEVMGLYENTLITIRNGSGTIIEQYIESTLVDTWIECHEDTSNSGGTDSSGSGGTSSGGPGSGDTTTPLLVLYKILNQLTNECAKEIFIDILEERQNAELKPEETIPNGETLTFSGTILNMFNESNKYDYRVFNTDGFSGTRTGGTWIESSTSDRMEINTAISNAYLDSATRLSIAATMIHESIHAYLLQQVDANGDFAAVMNQYIQQYGDGNRAHHEYMAEYVNLVAYSLYTWDKNNVIDGGNLGWDYYYAMAFRGLYYHDEQGVLHLTDSFKELVPSYIEQIEIMNILHNEDEANENSKSKKCN